MEGIRESKIVLIGFKPVILGKLQLGIICADLEALFPVDYQINL